MAKNAIFSIFFIKSIVFLYKVKTLAQNSAVYEEKRGCNAIGQNVCSNKEQVY